MIFEADSGKISVLLLIDLSAAFGTVDYTILLDRKTGLGSQAQC